MVPENVEAADPALDNAGRKALVRVYIALQRLRVGDYLDWLRIHYLQNDLEAPPAPADQALLREVEWAIGGLARCRL